MEAVKKALRENFSDLQRLVFTSPAEKGIPEKVSFRRVSLADPALIFQREEVRGKQAFTENLTEKAFLETADALLCGAYRQVLLYFPEYLESYRKTAKGKLLSNRDRKVKTSALPQKNNREKSVLLPEGADAPFMRELGIFTAEGKVAAPMRDKYRQINRFLEILDHAMQNEGDSEVTVLDFGCGKSYLTFLVYYYFSRIRKKKVRIIGYDLKADVVAHCNALAEKCGYGGLSFHVADVTRDVLSEEKITMVISLHACDVATDYALEYAIRRGVKYIFSVPCCQHEVNKSIQKGEGDFDLFLSKGLFRERFSALLTDAFRARILEENGYKTDVLEFVDFAHSPKNLMLRCRKTQWKKVPCYAELFRLEETYGFTQTLLHLLTDQKK